jgi:type I restriction enzyme S subunit
VSKGWPLVSMEEIFAIARGGSPRPIDRFLTDDPDGVNWVMISDATESGKYINSTKKRIREEGVKRSRVVQPGDFLLTNSMSFGRPYIMNTSGCIHDGWLVLSPRNQNVSRDFFYHLLGSDFVYAEFVRRAAGATVKNLNIDLVKSVQVPLPPLAEQRRVAEVLDRAEALRTNRRASLAELDDLIESVFTDLFGDPVTNPKVWPVTSLGGVARGKPNNGIFRKNPDYVQDGVEGLPVVWVEELFRGSRIDITESRRVRPTSAEVANYGLKHGDILFCRSSLKLDGIAFNNVYLGPDDAALFECHLIRVQPNLSIISPIYLNCLLRLPQLRAIAKSKSKTATMTTIDQTSLCSIPVMLPPLALQQQFERHVAAVATLKCKYDISLAKMDTLFAALQFRAFSGGL